MSSDAVDHWLAVLRRLYPAGLMFRDLTVSMPEWSTLAGINDPVILRLNASAISGAVEHLTDAGLSPTTTCALLEGDPEHGRWITGMTGDIATRSRRLPDGPILFMIAENLDPLRGMALSKQRLSGKTVLITRARKQAGTLRLLLEQEGARVLEAPAIEIVERPEKIAELEKAIMKSRYAWLVLTSVNTVNIVNNLLIGLKEDWRLFDNRKIACIGTATADRVRDLGGKVSLVPLKFQAESLAEQLLRQGIAGKNILLPRAEGSRRILIDELEAHGAAVDEIQVYRAEIPAGSQEELLRILENEPVDFITFTSSSTAHHFVEMAGSLLSKLTPNKTRIASIGPITSETLREYGLIVSVEASEFTIHGLVEALARAL